MRRGQFLTTFVALGVVGLLSGCSTAGNINNTGTGSNHGNGVGLSVNHSDSTNIANSSSSDTRTNPANNSTGNPTGNPSNKTAKNTGDTNSSQSRKSGQEPGASGQQSGTKSGTAGYSKGLKTVNYASSELQKIQDVSQQQGISAYVPGKMGGPSGYYIPGAVSKASNHTMSLRFEDMTFYEGPSWQAIQRSLTPQSSSLSVLKGGSYTLTGEVPGQWYTLKYSNGSRSVIFVFQKGGTWIGIIPNPAKSTIPSLIQAVAQTLKPV